MKPVTYTLSNRQRKELLERDRPLVIALPAPDQDKYDAVDFVLRVLPEVERSWIVEAREMLIPVLPTSRGGGGLGEMLGEIDHRDHGTRWHVQVLCVVVELQACRVARARRGLCQWPGGVVDYE